jgi:cold shock CspA family protein
MPSLRQSIPLFPGLALALLTSAGPARADEFRGVISGVDLGKNEIRVEGRGGARGTTLSFALDEKTLVLFGSEKAAAADLSTGRRVRVEFEGDRDGARVARVVRVNGRPPVARNVLGVPPVASGPNTGPTTPVSPGDSVTGVLQRVALADREIVVIGPGPKGPETETTVAVPDTAKVVRDGKPTSLQSLKEGDAVAVRVERRDGKVAAVEVQAGPGAALSPAEAKGPERGRAVHRLRQALHMADDLLRGLDPEDASRHEPQRP